MTTLGWAWHELVLHHGPSYVELSPGGDTRKHGTVIECPCGRRWLARAPWFR